MISVTIHVEVERERIFNLEEDFEEFLLDNMSTYSDSVSGPEYFVELYVTAASEQLPESIAKAIARLEELIQIFRGEK